MIRVDNFNNVWLTRGDDAVFTVEILNEDGTIYTLANNDILKLTLKKDLVSSPALTKTVTGSDTIRILHSDTTDLSGVYLYDVQLTKGSDSTIHTVVGDDGEHAPLFTIVEDVTR